MLVIAKGDDEKARRVVEGLQARLEEVTTKIARLAEQLRRLKAENARLTVENEQLRQKLQTEQADAEMVEAALQVVIDRIPVSA